MNASPARAPLVRTGALSLVREDGADPVVRAGYHVTVIGELRSATQLAPRWRELARTCAASPFDDPDYALTWWQHCGRGTLAVTAVTLAGELVALAPLHVVRRGGLRVARWLGHGLGTVAQVLLAPGHPGAARALWAAVAEQVDLLELLDFRDDGGGLSQLRRSRALVSVAELRDVCPVLDLTSADSGEAVLTRLSVRHPLRRAVRRAERQLRADGVDFRAEVGRDPDDLERLLPLVAAVGAAAAAPRRPDFLARPGGAFGRALCRAMASRGRLSVHVGHIAGRAAAVEITLDDPAVAASWYARYDPAFAAYAPGHLLSRAVVDATVARGARRWDLMLGDGPHKLPWASGSYDTLSVYAAARALPVRRARLALDTSLRRALRQAVGAGRAVGVDAGRIARLRRPGLRTGSPA